MPHKFKLKIRDKIVRVERDDGKNIRVSGATKIEIDHHREKDLKVAVTMWCNDGDAEMTITEDTAMAILALDHQRSVSFISNDEAQALRDMMTFLATTKSFAEDVKHIVALQPAFAAIDKIIRVLDRREEIPF